ncbi:hypothetical protein THJ114_16310 [Campylobacter jejuni]|nr:hypothetical protein THJ114_16310 [Campylobacter jejuni]
MVEPCELEILVLPLPEELIPPLIVPPLLLLITISALLVLSILPPILPELEISSLLSLLLVIEPLIPVDDVEVLVIESSLLFLSTVIEPEIAPLPSLVMESILLPPLT